MHSYKKIIASALFLLTIHFSVVSQPLRVMTYNIRYDNPQDGINAWPNRKQKVADLIRKYDPDLIGLQEAMHHQILDLLHALPEYAFVGVGRDDGKQKGEYSPILYKKSKFRILKQNTFWLSETPAVPGSKSWDAAITRVATWACVKDLSTGKRFFAINTHFDHIGQEARTNSAKLIAKNIAQLSDGNPVVMTGDFNCTREEPPYQALMSNPEIKLIDTATPNALGTYCTFETNVACKPIDYVFHSSKMSSQNYRVITDNDGKYYPSDHLPVVVEVTLTE
jgi:endonuclease/exonuclease/phosphatase family metal-dependent hydrolase